MKWDSIPVEFLFTYRAELGVCSLPDCPGGERLLTWVTSGSFQGPGLEGSIAPGPSSAEPL